MWVFLNDAFFSIVAHPQRKRLMIVRARKPGDIPCVFGPKGIKVEHTPARDYPYRAVIGRERVALTMAHEVRRIDYGNFKDSVADDDRHDAYSEVWTVMLRWGKGLLPSWRRPQPTLWDVPDWRLPDDDGGIPWLPPGTKEETLP